MPDNIAGRVAGEVISIEQVQNFLKLSIITYSTDKDDKTKRASLANGTLVDPNVLAFEVHDPNVIHQIQQTVRQGSNIEVGYKYFNKNNTTYDEYGFATQGDVIERLEIGKLIVHGTQQQQPQGQGFGGQGFGGNQAGGFGGQQQQTQGFGQQQQQPSFGNQPGGPFNSNNYPSNQQGLGNEQPPQGSVPFDANYQQQPQGGFGDPFAGQGQQLDNNNPFAQEANQMFGQNNQQNGFGFGN